MLFMNFAQLPRKNSHIENPRFGLTRRCAQLISSDPSDGARLSLVSYAGKVYIGERKIRAKPLQATHGANRRRTGAKLRHTLRSRYFWGRENAQEYHG